jgi:LCP family protein required for cell wall assembly
MTRLENALHALADHDEHEVQSVRATAQTLADGAMLRAGRRHRRRRAGTLAGTAALVAAIAVGVPQLTAATRAGGPADAPAASSSPTAAGLPPRVTVLFLGSDAGPDRAGVRIDSVIVASIDTRSGDTLLVGVPRNLQHVPFKAGTPLAQKYPDGFACPGATSSPCLLNGLWQVGEQNRRDAYFRRFAEPGRQAVVDGVEAVTGLRMDQVVVADMRGFAALVDAVGGVTVDVRRRIPIAGHVGSNGEQTGVKAYLESGRRHLDGYQALWFARSRSDSSDYDRMQRQRCLVAALAAQLDWSRIAGSYPQLLKALGDSVRTTIPAQDLPRWAQLAGIVGSKGTLRSLALTPGLVDPVNPDFAAVRRLVADAVEQRGAGQSRPGENRTGPKAVLETAKEC